MDIRKVIVGMMAVMGLMGCDPDRHDIYCPVSGPDLSYDDKTAPAPQCESLEDTRKWLTGRDVSGYGEVISVDGGPHLETDNKLYSCCYDITYVTNGMP